MKISISQTDYIDFITKSGVPKFTKVKSIFNRPDYHPAFDFYKILRDEIISNIKVGKEKSELLNLLGKVEHTKKYFRYTSLIRGYLRFLGRKKISWFEPPITYWIYKDLSIRINPEIGCVINEEKYIIKLYFKEQPLAKKEARVILWMMGQTINPDILSGCKCALMDVERGKLHLLKSGDMVIAPLIEGEAESFIKMWNSLQMAA